ncbi:accessory gland protein Acp29AB-like [Drosophila takahashii]|uniref:accessory gland protein Acp29AB-like n=1 Tax=Drosophila takahashii TaxID=29030 RepID=UPI001CF82EE6|nr:accessory gland protein Acp29AB-like [Drosophila takahashii]
MTALKPLIDHIANHQELWNSRDSLKMNETHEDLARIKGQLETIQGTLRNIISEDLKERLGQIEVQQTALLDSLAKIQMKIMPPNFKRIGSRFFDIESNTKLDWKSAENSCRQVGGHLAIIQSEEEFAAINANLDRNSIYWLGIHEPSNRSEFMSLDSGKRAPFLKWEPGEPKYVDNSNHCVVVYKAHMWVDPCTYKALFICQADDRV